jgi:response regulator RpfG family c-di-GMP phosphodiesterase
MDMWMRVLIADEDAQSRASLSGLLLECGCEVGTAADIRQTVVKALEFMPELILMDIKMEGAGNGTDVLDRIRLASAQSNAKIIALVPEDMKDAQAKAEKSGFDGFFPTPVDADKFRDFIGNYRQKNRAAANSARILCVDDEPLNLELLEAILIPAGYEVINAADGHEALAELKRSDIDIVLLDVMMPEMDGYEVCRLIKASAETSRIPVIMITALSSKEDRIKSIEAGAGDFITKPFEKTEVLTRIRKLLEIKEQNSKLISLFGVLTGLTERGNRSAELLSGGRFNFFSEVDALIRGTNSGKNRGPRGMLFGSVEMGWINYDMTDPESYKAGKWTAADGLAFLFDGQARFYYSSGGESLSREAHGTAEALAKIGIKAGNFICRAGAGLCLVSYGFEKPLNNEDTVVLKALVMQIMFLHSIAVEILETEKAYDYLILTLARAAEANDEDTGLHVIRVGEYAAFLAGKMGLDPEFVGRIRMQAQLHDVGKIHIPAAILKKPAPLTPEEFELMKLHTVYGAKIIGSHGKFGMGKNIAFYHHEKWDGSGYPKGLKGEEIPLEARIAAVADQYDALRNERIYKPAFSHEKAYEIMVKGDGRTKPGHFAPDVLSAFINHAAAFEEIYNKLNG